MRKSLSMMAAALSLAVQVPAHASGGGEEAGGVHLVTMDEIRVPIVDGDRADGTLRLKLVLEAADAAAAQKMEEGLPVLRAASLGAAVEFARLYASPMTPVDAGRLAADMTGALKRDNPGLARVLLVEVAAVRS